LSFLYGLAYYLDRRRRPCFNAYIFIFLSTPRSSLLWRELGLPSWTFYFNKGRVASPKRNGKFDTVRRIVNRFPRYDRVSKRIKVVRNTDLVESFIALLLLRAESRPEALGLSLIPQELKQSLAFIRVNLPCRILITPLRLGL
jgi:hypothetical protein